MLFTAIFNAYLKSLLLLCTLYLVIIISMCWSLDLRPLISLDSSSHSSNNGSYLNITLSFSDVLDPFKRTSLHNSEILPKLPDVTTSTFNTGTTFLNVNTSNNIVNAGTSFSINCSTSSSTEHILEWYKDSTQLISYMSNVNIISQSKEMDSNIFQSTYLTIKLATLQDSGMYTCKTSDKLLSNSINISVVTKEGTNCKSNKDCQQETLACIRNICHCINGTVARYGACLSGRSIGKDCIFDEECSIIVPRSKCFENCNCPDDYKLTTVEGRRRCVLRTAIVGSECKDNADCRKEVTNMVCQNNRCDCENENSIFLKNIIGHPGKCYPQGKRGNECSRSEQCKISDPNLICQYYRCECDPAYTYSTIYGRGRCYRKATAIYDPCEVDGQCFNINAVCSQQKLCSCQSGYYYNNRECIRQGNDERSKAQQVYRTAMIAAACFMIGVVSIFVVCIVKKTFCVNNNTSAVPGGQRTGSQLQRMTSLNDEDLIVSDKPPSYEEILMADLPNTPPPKYTDISKLFPITENLQRHSSEPRLNVANMRSERYRSNSFHTNENSAHSSSNNEINIMIESDIQPPKYEEKCKAPKPSLHLDIPEITVSFTPVTAVNENNLPSYNNVSPEPQV